jgi:hypothetical protein
MRGEARIHVAAPAEQVYAMVSDITRMGEWSPETKKAYWVGGATGPSVGARFRGINRSGLFVWWTTPQVIEAEPGKVFAFKTSDTTWRYRFHPQEGGTEVVESFETSHVPWAFRGLYQLTNRERILVKGMEKTLQRIKSAAEAR